MIETSSTIARKHSATFGNLRKSSDIFGNFRKMIGNVRMNFGHRSENFEKSSEIFGKLLKYPWCCCLYNKQNITCPLVDTNFIFSCSTRYLTSELRSLVRYRVEHSKIKFVSTRGHVISFKWQYGGIHFYGTRIKWSSNLLLCSIFGLILLVETSRVLAFFPLSGAGVILNIIEITSVVR